MNIDCNYCIASHLGVGHIHVVHVQLVWGFHESVEKNNGL